MKDPDEFKKRFDSHCRRKGVGSMRSRPKLALITDIRSTNTGLSELVNNELRSTGISIDQVLRLPAKYFNLRPNEEGGFGRASPGTTSLRHNPEEMANCRSSKG